jgi:hypothetical protein|tara:strand:+ start:357 stop:533 length:177 start_codon:yes stop_codon:yes gene_type:complete
MGNRTNPLIILFFGISYFFIGFALDQPYNMLLWFIAGGMCGLSAAQVIIEKCMKGKDD